MASRYEKKLKKMNKNQFAKEMKKYFNGSAPKCEVEQAKDCVFYEKYEKNGVLGCEVIDRENCLGCSFYRTEEVGE